MKKKLHYSSQFKKDYKRYVHQEEKIKILFLILRMLENGEDIPQEYFPHKLHHDYKGCMECHVQDDFLLIWMDGNIIELLRLGSHSELFGKGRKR